MEEMTPVGYEKKNPMEYLSLGWIFETWYEKLIIFVSMAALIYSVFRIIVQGFW